MNCLLVGGAADGRRVVIPDGVKHYDVVVYERTLTSLGDPRKPVSQEVQHYNFFELHPVTRAFLFVHESLTPTQVLEALMDGYRQESVR